MVNKKGNVFVTILILIALAAGGWWFFSSSQKNNGSSDLATTTESVADQPIIPESDITLAEQNKSGITGTATLTEESGKTRIKIALDDTATSTRPAHIVIGTCAKPGAVKYPLVDVVNGMSDSSLDVSFAKLRTQLPLALSIQKSATSTKVSVVCGAITLPDVATSTETTATSTANTVTVKFTDKGFEPAKVTVNKGDTVTFVNESKTKMWVATAKHPTHTGYPGSDIKKCGTAEQPTIFDECEAVTNGTSWSFVFNEIGTWAYHEHTADKFFGSVTVK